MRNIHILTCYRAQIEEDLKHTTMGDSPLLAMVRYHLGLTNRKDSFSRGMQSRGKLLRSSLCLATCEALGGDVHKAYPVATAFELAHKCSLIFDDIQDKAPERNQRPSLWAMWGEEQAINAGLTLSCLCRIALLELEKRGVSSHKAVEIRRLLEETVVLVCLGQYQDISLQTRDSISKGEYLDMIKFKTGAPLKSACEVGAMLADRDEGLIKDFGHLGETLGIIFQVRDDILDTHPNPQGNREGALFPAITKVRDFEAQSILEDYQEEASHFLNRLPLTDEWKHAFNQLIRFMTRRGY